MFIPDDDDDSIDNPISWEDNDKRKADKAGSDSDSESEDDASEKGAKNRPKHKEGLRKREEQLLREKEVSLQTVFWINC